MVIIFELFKEERDLHKKFSEVLLFVQNNIKFL